MRGCSVAVTAWSVYNPVAQSRAEFRSALVANRCGLTPTPRLADSRRELNSIPGLSFVPYLGTLGDWPVSNGVPLAIDTRQLRLARAALGELLPNLLSAIERWGPARVGLVLGTSTGGLRSSELCYPGVRTGAPLPEWYSCRDGHAFDAAPRRLAAELGLAGPVGVVSTACSSAGKALAAARRWLENGVCDAVLAGGVDTLCLLTVMGFASLGVLANEPCRPFASTATGMNVAEGAAWLLLERGTGSLLLAGTGESSDAHHLVTPEPEGRGTRLAIELALRSAGLEPHAIDYVNAHGTGTQANDVPEGKVLRALFPSCPIQGSKANHGHQLGASAATEAVICLEVLRGLQVTSQLPALGEAAQSSRLFDTAKGARAVLSNTLGFGGSNVCLVFTHGPSTATATAATTATVATTAEAATGGSTTSRAALEFEISKLAVWAPELPPNSVPGLIASPPRAADAPGWLLPNAALLSARERGRAAPLTCLFAECLAHLGTPEELRRLPMVYGSAFGPVSTTLELLEQQQRGECSPLRFQSSVHNTAAGVLSIALGNTQFTTATAAGEQTTAFALLEAMCWLGSHPEDDAVIVLLGDEAPPRPLLDEVYTPLAVGILLQRCGRDPKAQSLGVCRWVDSATPEPSEPSTTPAANAHDEALIRALANPCGAALALARTLGRPRDSRLMLPLGQHRALSGGIEIRTLARSKRD